MSCLKIQSLTGLFLYNFFGTFFGEDVSLSKYAVTELYKNSSLWVEKKHWIWKSVWFNCPHEFWNTFQLKYFPIKILFNFLYTLQHWWSRSSHQKKQWKSKKKMYQFFKKPSDEKEFEVQIIEDILEHYEH